MAAGDNDYGLCGVSGWRATNKTVLNRVVILLAGNSGNYKNKHDGSFGT